MAAKTEAKPAAQPVAAARLIISSRVQPMDDQDIVKAIVASLREYHSNVLDGHPRDTTCSGESGGVVVTAAWRISMDDIRHEMAELERKTMVLLHGQPRRFDACVALMDDGLREQLHADMAPCAPQTFLDAYVDAHLEKYHEEFRCD